MTQSPEIVSVKQQTHIHTESTTFKAQHTQQYLLVFPLDEWVLVADGGGGVEGVWLVGEQRLVVEVDLQTHGHTREHRHADPEKHTYH